MTFIFRRRQDTILARPVFYNGQEKHEDTALAGGGLDMKGALVGFDDPVCCGKPQAGPPAPNLSCKKGIKYAGKSLLVHTRPGVCHTDPDIIPGLLQSNLLGPLDIHDHVSRFHHNLTAFGHGMPGIDKQIHKHLLDLKFIHHYGPQRLIQFLVDDDIFSGATEHFG